MLSYFGSKTPASKLNNPENKLPVSEKLVHYETYMELNEKLQVAKDQIQELESKLATKEQLHDELHQKIQTLMTTIEQEKSVAKEQEVKFAQEEDALATEIASLKVDLITQECNYETLRKNIIKLQAKEEEQLELQQQYSTLEAKMNEKEQEYEALANKITELEFAKKHIEERLAQEQNDHQETKSALAIEKKARQPNPVIPESKSIQQMPNIANNHSTLFNNNQPKPDPYRPYYLNRWEMSCSDF
jgi:chromosome segregation ATPase